MNDEETTVQAEDLFDLPTGDPIPQASASAADGGMRTMPPEEEPFFEGEGLGGDAVADPDVFADPLPPADPDSGASAAEAEEERLDCLRGELSRLKETLRLREERFSRLGGECEEFCALYPDVPFFALPDQVWQDVRQGIPIAAAYALAERKRMCAAQKAEQSNRENRSRSVGEVKSGQGEEFSPAEVRAMTPQQVRDNYSTILRSMQKWH